MNHEKDTKFSLNGIFKRKVKEFLFYQTGLHIFSANIVYDNIQQIRGWILLLIGWNDKHTLK